MATSEPETNQEKEKQVRLEIGAIALVDVLGFKNAIKGSRARETLKLWEHFQEHIRAAGSTMHNYWKEDWAAPGDQSTPPETSGLIFSDTLALTLVHKSGKQDPIVLLGQSLVHPVAEAIAMGLLVRGAIGYGEFGSNGQTLIGAGVAEVADWYEASDWVGIHLAPSAVESVERSLGSTTGSTPVFARYDVPIRGGSPLRSWFALDWPRRFGPGYSAKELLRDCPHELEGEKFKDLVVSQLRPRAQMPPDVARK